MMEINDIIDIIAILISIVNILGSINIKRSEKPWRTIPTIKYIIFLCLTA